MEHKGNFKLAVEQMKNDKNNAIKRYYTTENPNQGPLSGTTYTLKDIYAMKNKKVTASSDLLKGFKPEYTSDVYRLLKASGASIVGQTNLDEFGMGGTGTYSNQGIITHPDNSEYMIAGSSSGAAATLTNEMGFAIGSDTGDSVRLPANHIGKVGFKPTYGSVSRYGLFSYASSLDTVAWFTHNVNDAYEVGKVLFEKSEKDMTSIDNPLGELKVCKPKTVLAHDVFHLLKEPVKKTYKKLIQKLIDDGVKVKIEKLNKELTQTITPIYQVISYSEASSNLSNLNGLTFGNSEPGRDWEEIMINTRSKYFGHLVKRRLTLGAYFLHKSNQEEIFLKAKKIRRLLTNYMNEHFQNHDLIIFPASASWAPKFCEDMSKHLYMNSILTRANLVGNPSLTQYLGKDAESQMPFNIALETDVKKDTKLFNYSLYIENLIKEMNND